LQFKDRLGGERDREGGKRIETEKRKKERKKERKKGRRKGQNEKKHKRETNK
jgi:hypothetical protein